MNQIDAGGWAFPMALGSWEGMTLRDYFAAKFMAALIVEGRLIHYNGDNNRDDLATDAYQIADAMIKARAT